MLNIYTFWKDTYWGVSLRMTLVSFFFFLLCWWVTFIKIKMVVNEVRAVS